MNTSHLVIFFSEKCKKPSEFHFQDNSNLLKINYKLYILKQIFVSIQYASPYIVYIISF